MNTKKLAEILAMTALVPAAGCSLQVDPAEHDQLGTTAEPDAILNVPGPQPQLPEFLSSITAGQAHSCVRTTYGRVFCWGANDIGQIGNVVVNNPHVTPMGCALVGACIDRPRQVDLSPNVVQVDAGADHTCALTSAGTVYCWGSDAQGQVGEGNGSFTAGTPFPQMQPDGTQGLKFSSISAGSMATCGIASGQVYCWGLMGPPPGGTIATGHSSTAYPVLDQNGNPLLGYDSISVGSGHACGMAGGYENCWGNDFYGEIGTGSATIAVRAPWCLSTRSCPPAPTLTAVSTQAYFTCEEWSNGSVKCFGRNDYGQLGNPSNTSGSTATAQTVAGGLSLHHVSVGESHACGLDATGAAYCWGRGDYGQLGDGSAKHQPAPVRVAGTMTYKAIAAGSWHTCAIGTDDNIWCWGSNGVGQLGSGVWQDAPTPVQASEECIRPNSAHPCP
jgi:alpha-tubulin suppressor-like RCC1 family protein